MFKEISALVKRIDHGQLARLVKLVFVQGEFYLEKNQSAFSKQPKN